MPAFLLPDCLLFFPALLPAGSLIAEGEPFPSCELFVTPGSSDPIFASPCLCRRRRWLNCLLHSKNIPAFEISEGTRFLNMAANFGSYASQPENFLGAEACNQALESLHIEHDKPCMDVVENSTFLSSSEATEMEFEKRKLSCKDEGYISWICAICHDRIKLEETAQIKGCEHAYCAMCILRWASYKAEPWCPQCRLPFSFLHVYRGLDGSLNDYLFEESVCLLLRASWFKPLPVQELPEQDDFQEEYDAYEEEEYYTSSVRLGNRRWGDSGFVRAGRKEARPVGIRQVPAATAGETSGSSSSGQSKGKEPAKERTGRRAKRALKREAANQVAAAKQQHQQLCSEGKHARGPVN